MNILTVAPCCPDDLVLAIQSARCFSDVFDTVKPICFHADCHVTECRTRTVRVTPRPEASCSSSSYDLSNAGGKRPVVVKTYLRLQMSSATLQQVLAEVRIHSALPKHPNIIPLLVAFEDTRHLYVVVDRADGGDLRQHLMPESHAAGSGRPGCGGGGGGLGMGQRQKGLGGGLGREGHAIEFQARDQKEARLRDWVLVPLLRALAMLQDEGVVHRDVKPENCLVHEGRVLLADFGLATRPHPAREEGKDSLGEGEHGSVASSPDLLSSATVSLVEPLSRTASLCYRPEPSDEFSAAGTPLYAAPEVLRTMFENKTVNDDVIHHKNDVWALGILTLEAALGYHPLAFLERGGGGGGAHMGPRAHTASEDGSTGRGGQSTQAQSTKAPHYYHAYSGNNGNVLYNIAHLAEVPIPPASPESCPISPSSELFHEEEEDQGGQVEDMAPAPSSGSLTSSSSPSLLGPQLREVLVSMVKTDPQERLTARQVLNTFPWLSTFEAAASLPHLQEEVACCHKARGRTSKAVPTCLPPTGLRPVTAFELVECWEV